MKVVVSEDCVLSSQNHVCRVWTNLRVLVVVIVVVASQGTSIGHDLLSKGGLGRDGTIKVDLQGGDSGEQKSESAELHFY